jgi:Uma2 family endonuclease
MSTAPAVHVTPQQYLALERKASERSEYIDGAIYPMAGASRNHSLIAGNMYRVISIYLLNRPGEVHVVDMRVRISSTGRYTYPDVVAVSDAPQFEDAELDTLLNPTVIVEVLSPSTEADDRGDKFARYRRIPSLCEYVLVNQDCVLVERFTRRGDEWVLSEFDSLDQILRLESLGCDVPLREVYAKTTVAAGSGQETV